jgi:tetratricopeptide (TPR) repeat protein
MMFAVRPKAFRSSGGLSSFRPWKGLRMTPPPDRRGGDCPQRREPPQRPQRRDGAPQRRDGAPSRPPRPRDDVATPRTPRLREPDLPDDITPRDLDRDARAELRSLPASLADKVALHLVAAGRALDEEPQAAHAHAWYARQLAPRLAIVREAAGVTAYAVGDYAAALAELRAVRRMTGDPGGLPMMADCERGLGRPDRALALARDPDAKKLDAAAKIELGIVVSGARRDRGEHDAAVVALQGPALDSDQLQPWSARLWYAYADALLAAGRRDDARRWFESVAAIDDTGETDAEERVAELTDA